MLEQQLAVSVEAATLTWSLPVQPLLHRQRGAVIGQCSGRAQRGAVAGRCSGSAAAQRHEHEGQQRHEHEGQPQRGGARARGSGRQTTAHTQQRARDRTGPDRSCRGRCRRVHQCLQATATATKYSTSLRHIKRHTDGGLVQVGVLCAGTLAPLIDAAGLKMIQFRSTVN